MVQGLQARLKARYPQIRLDLSDSKKEIPFFDNFYIDFNALIYQCIRESGCFLKNKIKPLTFDQINERVVEYMLQLVRIANPQKLLFIALDGVAPRAKINQSRDRRFKSGIEDIAFFDSLAKQIGIKTQEIFQANSISPGTEFLLQLCANLKLKIMQLLDGEWKGLNVMFSDCCVPGEGEHKIMDFLRYGKKGGLFENDTTHCVYSPDADVILLTLSLGIQFISILKEDTSQKPNQNYTAISVFRKTGPPLFELVLINILREYLEKEFADAVKAGGGYLQPVLDDLVLLMAFVGNDFLPVEFCFVLKDNHMDNLFDSYKRYLQQQGQFINNSGVIDWKNVSKLLKIARKFEANMISELIKNKKSRANQYMVQQQKPADDQQQDDEIQKFQIVDQKIVRGVQNYYKTRFNIDERENSKNFDNIILKYIEGLEFYCQYYYKGLPSWTWYYPYHYTPLLCDVHDYILSHKIQVSLKRDAPFDPILALMFMLPEQNFGLLPKPVSQALLDPNCILKQPVDYFPKNFKLDKFETLKYNKRAIIQFLDEDSVRKVYQSIPKEKYSKDELKRNVRNKTIIFTQKNESFMGIQIQFEEKYLVEIKKIIKIQKNKSKLNKKCFPTLGIFGNFQLNGQGKIVANYKYKYQGNPSQVVFFNNFLGYVERCEKCTPEWKPQIQSSYEKAGICGKCQNYYIVKRANYVRQFNRFNLVLTKKQTIVPDFALFKAPNYDYIHKTQPFQPSKLYSLRERVVILTPKYFGYIGVVEQLQQKLVKVRLTQHPIRSQEKIQEFEQDFFTVNYVLNHLDISFHTLLAIISQVIILPSMKKKDFNERLPTALNFGLNFIDIPRLKIVPRFVRCQLEYENSKKPTDIFNYIEVSETGLKLLSKYVEKFHWLIDKLEEAGSNPRRELKATGLFPNEKNSNIRLYQQFIKLYQFDNKGSFYSIYSKVTANQQVNFITDKSSPLEIVTLDYYAIMSRRQAFISPPAYKNEPEYHAIGDRVILLRTLQTGHVIGIDDHWFHVIVGKNKKKHRVNFTQIYNQKWENSLSKQVGKVWNLEPCYFAPSFWKKAIQR